MSHYVDGFVLPIPSEQLATYKSVVKKVAAIWKEHGAIDYSEYVSDNAELEGTLSFSELPNVDKGEVVIFGWVSFESKEARDLVNKKVANDPRMEKIIEPLMTGDNPIFDAKRMAYGGFRSIV